MDGLVGDIVGGVSMAMGVVLAAVALLARRAGRAARRLEPEPTRYLYSATSVARYGGRTAIGVSGTVCNPPALRAPLTQRPCVGWEVGVLWEDDGVEHPEWHTVWSERRLQDLEVAYDMRRDHDEDRPPPDHPWLVPGPGTVKIAADRIMIVGITAMRSAAVDEVELPVGEETLIPRLRELGVPPELLDGVATSPHRYRIAEATLVEGAFVRCLQEDPDSDFLLFPGSLEEHLAYWGSCSAWAFLCAALFLLVAGYALTLGEP